jgi:GT2 family glycosyltransferase
MSTRQSLAQRTSAIVVAYNSGPFLHECIASIFRTQPDVEIVVVDNASTDDTVAQAEAEFPSITIVQNEKNAGFGAGCNLGAASTSREFLVFINPDTVVFEEWLEALVRPLEKDHSIGLVTPKVLMRDDPNHINVAGLNVHLSGISMCRGLGLPKMALAERSEVASISGVAFAARRKVFESIGGFDEDFFLYMEDVDLSLRVWLAGYRCLYVPDAIVLHDYDEVKVGTQKTFWVERGRYLMLLKAFRRQTLLKLLPTLLLAELITLGWVLWRNPRALGQKLRAWWWILAHWREIAGKRLLVERSRATSDATFLNQCTIEMAFDQLAGPKVAQAADLMFSPLFRGAARATQ